MVIVEYFLGAVAPKKEFTKLFYNYLRYRFKDLLQLSRGLVNIKIFTDLI